jgi:hypothetical protein
MKTRLVILALALVLPTAVLGSAQPLNTDIIVGGIAADILRISPTGKVTTVLTSVTPNARYINMLMMDNDNKNIVALDTLALSSRASQVIRVDPVARSVTTVWSGAPLTPTGPSYIGVNQNGDYLIADGANIFQLKPDGSSLTTFFTQAGASFDAFTTDVASGDWLFGSKATTKTVYHVDRITRTVVATGVLPTSPLAMGQDPTQSNVYIAGVVPNGVLSYLPASRTMTTIHGGTRTNYPNAMAVDRSPGKGGALIYCGMTSSPDLVSLDRNGSIVSKIVNISPARFLGITFDQSRNLAPIRINAPNDRTIRISFPSDPLKSYVMAASYTGSQPGVTLPDGRVIALTPDLLTVLSVAGSVGAILTGNVGVLGTDGSALARYNGNLLPPILKGFRVWFVAVSLDPAAPSGISQISRPLLIVQD